MGRMTVPAQGGGVSLRGHGFRQQPASHSQERQVGRRMRQSEERDQSPRGQRKSALTNLRTGLFNVMFF